MDVSGDLLSVSVPLGIYETMEAYCSALQEAGRDHHPTELKYFGVKFDPTLPIVRLRVLELTLHLGRPALVANLHDCWGLKLLCVHDDRNLIDF